MSFPEWFLTAMVIILVVGIALGLGYWIRNLLYPGVPDPNASIYVWGPIEPGTNPDKNFCQLYQFPTVVVPVTGVETVIPGAPTYANYILDTLTGTGTYPPCLDTDQLIAQQVKRTCIAPRGVVNGASTRCIDITGGVTGVGGTELYYTDAGCFKVQPCVGQLSLISPNYQVPSNFDIHCIENQGANRQVTVNNCDPSQQSQLFRITRIDPGQNPNSLPPGQGQGGLLGQFLDRVTGLCLIPGSAVTSTQYDPSSVGCSGPVQTLVGQEVILSSCTGGSVPGYVWAFLPSIQYCGVSGPCSPTVTPPQIAYVGNIDIDNIPGPSGYQGITGPSAIYKWLVDNNVQSLFYGGTGSGLILQPMATSSATCQDRAYTSQYINLSLFNTIQKQAVCSADVNPTTCISL